MQTKPIRVTYVHDGKQFELLLRLPASRETDLLYRTIDWASRRGVPVRLDLPPVTQPISA